MGQIAAKKGDRVVAIDTHQEVVPPGTIVSISNPFNGILDDELSDDVNIEGAAAATVGSTATNTPPHRPVVGTFVRSPSNQATIKAGSDTVFINGEPAARNNDTAETCNDPKDAPVGRVQATGEVYIG